MVMSKQRPDLEVRSNRVNDCGCGLLDDSTMRAETIESARPGERADWRTAREHATQWRWAPQGLTAACVLLLLSTACQHQGVKNAPPPAPGTNEGQPVVGVTAPPPPPPPPAPGGGKEPAPAGDVANQQGRPHPKASLGDYIPCQFTEATEQWLRKGYTPLDRSKSSSSKAANGATNSFEQAEGQDIGCSASVLTWDETRWIFGRKIADTYIAFQVTARNTNPNQEFLIHDLQVAVPDQSVDSLCRPAGTDDSPAAGKPKDPGTCTHFMSGRDRILVRGVGQTGQAFTSRNIAERVLEAVSGIMGAVAGVAGTAEFGSAVHIFSAVGVPGFNKVLPDLNADQIDRLNDLGFSANSAYKIIIPKNGSVPMTTFLPSAIFASKYRTWPQEKLVKFADSAVVVLGGKHIQEVSDQASLTDVKCPLLDNFLDLSKASGDNLQCQISGTDLQLLTSVRLKNDVNADDQTTVDGVSSLSGSTTSGTVTFSVKKLLDLPAPRYRAYGEGASGESASSWRINLPPMASALNPAQVKLDGSGGCDAAPKTTCSIAITGHNLDLVSTVQLLKSSDNSKAISGTWTAGGKTAATAVFQLADIKKLQAGDYLIGFVTADGTALPSTAKLTLVAP